MLKKFKRGFMVFLAAALAVIIGVQGTDISSVAYACSVTASAAADTTLAQPVDGVYNIVNKNSGNYLNVPGASTVSSTAVTQSTANGTIAQNWLVHSAGDGYYYITPAVNEQECLDVKGALDVNSTLVEVYYYHDSDNQKWKFIINSDGTYSMMPKISTSRVLDVKGASTDSGASIQIYSDNSGTNQEWTLKKVNTPASGIYTIKNKKSGKVFDVKQANSDPGTTVQQYDSADTLNQRWKVESCNGYYIISPCLAVNMSLDAATGSDNVQINNSDSSSDQKWFLISNADGTYRIMPLSSYTRILDVKGQGTSSTLPIIVDDFLSSDSQKWSFIGCNDTTAPTVSLSAPDSWGISNEVSADISDASGISVQKWALGNLPASYFSTNGTTFSGSSFEADKNGVYTVYAKDNAGNETIKTVTVNHVFTAKPVGSYNESFTDISVDSPGISVNIGRTYDSSNNNIGPFGTGWTFSCSANIKDYSYTYTDASGNTCTDTVSGMKVVNMPDGSNYTFLLQNGKYSAYNTRDTLTEETDETFTLYDNGEKLKYHFNSTGFLDSITDNNGNSETFTVDSSGNVNSIKDTEGRTYAVNYTDGKITSIKDPMNRTFYYGYTGNSLTSVTDPMNETTTYIYGSNSFTVKDPLGNAEETVEFDESGNVQSVTDSKGSKSTYGYDSNTNTVTVTAENGSSETYTYDANNLLTQKQDSDNTSESYDQYGETVSSTDSGGITQTAYDASGNIITVTHPNGSTETYTYYTSGNAEYYKDQNGKTTFYKYDGSGNVTFQAVPKNSSDVYTDGQSDDSLFDITRYTYNSDGTPATQTDPDGTVTEYTYKNGYAVLAVATKGTAVTDTETTYNAIGWVTKSSVTSGSTAASVDTDYDSDGRTLRTKNQDSNYTRYVYDAAGRLIQQISSDKYDGSKDGLNASPTNYTYSDTGVGERYVYDAYGNTLRYTNEQNETTRYVYNNRRLVHQINPEQYSATYDGLNSSPSADTYSDGTVGIRYVYDSKGNLLRYTDSSNKTTRYVYNSNNELIQKIDSNQYSSDKDGLADNDGNGLEDTGSSDTYSDKTVGSRYIYDGSGNTIKETSSDGNTTRYIYDGNGNMTQQVNPNQYSSVNDGLKDADFDGLPDSGSSNTYSDKTVGYNYSYYDSGTMKTQTTPDASTFSYNEDGNVTTEKYSDGSTNTTSYNTDGTASGVSNSSGRSLAYSYDGLSNITGYDLKFGSNETKYDYMYDENGNILTEIKSGNQQVKYYYDSDNQLVREDNKVLNKTISYSYDAGGNIKSKTEYVYTEASDLSTLTPTHTYSYVYGNAADKNQLTAYDGNAVQYDSDGNMTSYGGWNYTWSNGKLSSASKDANCVSCTYNADGIRTSKTVNGVKTSYTLDGDRIASQTDGTDTISYTYDSNGKPYSMKLNGTIYYYELNLQGDVIGLIDSNNNVVVNYTYDSWGNLQSIGGSLAGTLGKKNPLRYRGYYFDTETGMYYLQSRYYSPEIGRFISRDDAQYHEGDTGVKANLYAYCDNNPVMNVDPDGHFVFAIAVGAYFIPGIGEILITATIIAAAVCLTIWLFCLIYHFTKSKISKLQTISKADSKIRSKVKRNSRTRYWSATVHANYVDIGRPLTYRQAVSEVRKGHNVFTVTGAEAKALTTVAGNGHTPEGPEINKGMNGVKGYYWHYHTYTRNGGHVYYLFG